MIPKPIDRFLSGLETPLGAHYAAYKEWRWGDRQLRWLGRLCDPRKLSIDVGAHRGSHTYFLRRHSLRCLAIEPNPALAQVIRRRFRSRVEVLECAVSNAAGQAELRIPGGPTGLGRATIERSNPLEGDAHQVRSIDVPVMRLDDIASEPVGMMKIDVEGHELSALQGAERIVAMDRPNLLLELEERHRTGITAETFAYLQERGYLGWFTWGGAARSVSEFDPRLHQNTGAGEYAYNFVFSTQPGLYASLR